MRRLLENETLASPATKWVSPEKREQSCEDNLAWSYGPCHACLEIEKGWVHECVAEVQVCSKNSWLVHGSIS